MILLKNNNNRAFTLAETLIALAVIGIVAALTIPGLVKHYQERAWATAQEVFENRLDVAMKVMNTSEKLAGYASTADFINELKKNIKITHVCDKNELTKCFAKEIKINKVSDPVSIENGAEFTIADGTTLDDVVGVRFNNGVTALMAYIPTCEEDPYNNQYSPIGSCLAVLYDVNGFKSPNSHVGNADIDGNIDKLNNTQVCTIDLDDMCIAKILGPSTDYSPMTLAECQEAVTDGSLGINECHYDPDYWAGAVKACGGTNKMPTNAQLESLATYLYPGASTSSGGTTNATRDNDLALPFIQAYGTSVTGAFSVWSGVEYSSSYAYYRLFNSTGTGYYNGGSRGDSSYLAVCLGD